MTFHQDLAYKHAEGIIQPPLFSLNTEIYLEALFEHWLALEPLSETVKTHLKQLQTGFIPLVIADETFLTYHHHPMRQALRSLIEHCYLFTFSHENTLLVKVEYKIHQLALRFLQGNLPANATKSYWESIYEEVSAFLKSLKATDSAFNERYMTRLEKENLSWQKSKEEGNAWVKHTWQGVTCPIIWQFFLVETVPCLLAQSARSGYTKELLQTILSRFFSGHSTPQNAQSWLLLIKALRGVLLASSYNSYALTHFSTLLEDHLFFNIETAKDLTIFSMSEPPAQASITQTRQTQKDEFDHVLKKVVGMQSLNTKR